MKNFITALFMGATVTVLPLNAQTNAATLLQEINETKTPVYTPPVNGGKVLQLKMQYGSPHIANPGEINALKKGKIATIGLVYTDHPKDARFDKLTRQRIEALKKLDPALFGNEEIQWRLVRQTQCPDRASAQKLFHGISITYKPAQNPELMKKELTWLDSVFKSNSTHNIKTEKLLNYSYTETYTIDPKTKKKIVLKSDTTYFSEGPYTAVPAAPVVMHFTLPPFTDDVVTQTLNRNNWKNMLVVADVTGSMSPYTAQLFAWIKLANLGERVKHFVFFNDGDLTPDDKKVIGRTGGIYNGEATTFEAAFELAQKAMRQGGGGDIPENNVEALLKGMEVCPGAEHIVMIADNWAPVKDVSLLKALDKPIHIILCGSGIGINTQYLDIARATGGSVHTMEQDLAQLAKMNEGEELEINGQFFKISKGKFVPVIRV